MSNTKWYIIPSYNIDNIKSRNLKFSEHLLNIIDIPFTIDVDSYGRVCQIKTETGIVISSKNNPDICIFKSETFATLAYEITLQSIKMDNSISINEVLHTTDDAKRLIKKLISMLPVLESHNEK